jgi:REP element-mobilizing transposase RayT
MPSRNVIREFDVPAYYHVYNRASGERKLFRDKSDREYFLDLIQKHLAENYDENNPAKTYAVEVVAYCLMGTHFHLLLYQEEDAEAITGYMRSVSTAYSMYYNRKYKSKGHVFQSKFRASRISNESYLQHITRYIHLNPRRYEEWPWSSYNDYIGKLDQDWVHNERIQDKDDIGQSYKKFVDEWASVDRRLRYNEVASYSAE